MSVPQASRRSLLRAAVRLLLPAALCQLSPFFRLRASMAMPLDQLLHSRAVETDAVHHRCYRAHAYIHLFALPIFSRQDVGGGYAVVEKGAAGNGDMIGLQFAGGSSGERAHGLNRVGLIQEAVVEQAGRCTEAAYFGFVVFSGEKNLEQGRKALQTNTSGSILYSAASGSGRNGRFHCAVSHFPVPAHFNWATFGQLTREMPALINKSTDTVNFDLQLERDPSTFLYSVRRAILSAEPKQNCNIVYNGKRYVLTTEKQPDPRTGVQMEARAVTHKPDSIWRLNGTITDVQTRQPAAFQLWYENGDVSGIPVRVEFYPTSYLRLVFEQTPSGDGTRFSYLFDAKPSRTQTSS